MSREPSPPPGTPLARDGAAGPTAAVGGLRVFVIPSWYPDPRHGLHGGVFLADAVGALARHRPELDLSVSLWGQGDLELSSARLRAWLARPPAAGPPRPTRRVVRERLVEYYRPAWSWRHGIARGNVAVVLRRNRANLADARAERGGMDLIHAHVSFPAGWIAMRLADEAGIPYVLTEHMSPFPFAHFTRGGIVIADVAEPLRRAARVTAVSRALAREIRERVGVVADVIPNGVDETWFTPPTGARAAGPFTFLTVGALQPQKGIDDLLRAIAALGATPEVRFRIAGDGPQATEYRALAQSLCVGDRVEWTGALDRAGVRDALRACDAFVLTSRHESFGVVYAEALACGKPVIATRCGGPEDIVHEANGALVPIGDVDAIATALGAFARGERRFDRAAIRADFERRFSSRVVADRFAALYHDVAGHGLAGHDVVGTR